MSTWPTHGLHCLLGGWEAFGLLLPLDLGGQRGRPHTPLLRPNPRSGGQRGADLWWPIGGLQGPGRPTSLLALQAPGGFSLSCLREAQFPELRWAGLAFPASKGALLQGASLPSGETCT